MSTDPLDDLLTRSAPATRGADPAALGTMIAEARTHARPRRRRRIAIGSGALALVLLGGAGVAAATDGFAWAPWAQDPVGAVSFTMANGFDCELRFSAYTGGADPAFVADVNRALEDWYRSADVVGAAEALLPAQRQAVDAEAVDADDDPGADLSLLPPEERADELAHRAWAREWLAWDLVVADLEADALRGAGFAVPDERMAGAERSGQIQCVDGDGALYAPGAGS